MRETSSRSTALAKEDGLMSVAVINLARIMSATVVKVD